MNCKVCGGSTSQKQTPRGMVFECNQDNGSCLNNKGYPSSTWAVQRNGAVAPQRPPQRALAPPSNGNRDDAIKWQVCLKVAGTCWNTSISATPDNIIAFARELYLAPIPTLNVVARVVQKAPQPEPEDEGQVY